MRALFVLPQREFDGAARALVDAAAAITARGHAALVATVPGSPVERAAQAQSVETAPLVADDGLFRRTRALRRLVESHFADVIVVIAERDLLGAAWASRKAHRTVVVRRIASGEGLERHWRSRMAERRVSVTYLIATAGSIGPVPAPTEVITAPVGVRVPDAPADVGDTLEPLLVCVGGSTRTRSLSDALRAFALLRERFPRLRLAVLGGVARHTDVRLHAASLGVTDGVEWVDDPLSRDAVLARGSIGCVVADGDDGVYGYLDLMAYGIPFVTRRVPNVERYVSHGIHAVLLPTLEPARVAAEFAVMIGSAARRGAMGATARARVEREFSDRLIAHVFEQATRRVRERAHAEAGSVR